MFHPCPTCQKPPVEKYKPFCSKRCADVDLGRWFSGSYALPAVETDEDSLNDNALGEGEN